MLSLSGLLGCNPQYDKGSIAYGTFGLAPLQDSVKILSSDGKPVGTISPIEAPYSLSDLSATDRNVFVALRAYEGRELVLHRYIFRPPYKKWDSVEVPANAGWTSGGVVLPGGTSFLYITQPPSKDGSWLLRTWNTSQNETHTVKDLGPFESGIRGWYKIGSTSADGRKAVLVGHRVKNGSVATTIFQVSLDTGEIGAICSEEDGCITAAFAPDGDRLAVFGENGLEIRTIANRPGASIAPLQVFAQGRYSGNRIDWCAKSDAILVPLKKLRGGGSLLLSVSTETGKAVVMATEDRANIDFVSCY